MGATQTTGSLGLLTSMSRVVEVLAPLNADERETLRDLLARLLDRAPTPA